MNKASLIATSLITALVIGGVAVRFTLPWLPNMFGYKERGWVHSGKVSFLGDTTHVRKWTGGEGWKGKRGGRGGDYMVKLKAGQRVEMVLSGQAKHGKVTVGVAKRAGYFHHPLKVGQISEGQYLRLKPESETQTLVYEITEDGFYYISISTIGKLNKNYTVKSDMRYDVRWRLT